jgi:hypothetical protein
MTFSESVFLNIEEPRTGRVAAAWHYPHDEYRRVLDLHSHPLRAVKNARADTALNY